MQLLIKKCTATETVNFYLLQNVNGSDVFIGTQNGQLIEQQRHQVTPETLVPLFNMPLAEASKFLKEVAEQKPLQQLIEEFNALIDGIALHTNDAAMVT